MADVVKRVSNALASPYRSQSFTEEDASEGDVINVKESLGRPARNCTIEVDSAGDGMSIRLNVKRTAYPKIPRREGMMYVDHLPYLPSGVDYTDESTALIHIEAGSTYEWETGPSISDIQIVTQSGHFDMFLS